jgi:hypothetical protein
MPRNHREILKNWGVFEGKRKKQRLRVNSDFERFSRLFRRFYISVILNSVLSLVCDARAL